MVEIADAELSRLLGADKLLKELVTSPKTKKSAQKDIASLHPEFTPDPETFTKDEISKIVEESLELSKSAEKKAKIEQDFQEKLNSYRLSEKNPDGYTDEGITKILELMKERTIPDVDAAVLLFEKLNPGKPEYPSGYTPTGWNFGHAEKDDTDRKLLFENEDAWLDQEARKVWEEERRKTNAA